MGEFSVWHLLIVMAVFMLLFGAKKLPEATRSVAQSLHIFKQELKSPGPSAPAASEPPPIQPPDRLSD